MKVSFGCLCTLAFSGSIWAAHADAQEVAEPLFPGAEYVECCTADLPPTYSEKDTARYVNAAFALDGVELIYLTVDKKGGHATYKRMHVGLFSDLVHVTVIYASAKEYRHRNVTGNIMDLMDPVFNPNVRFYLAQCFDEQLAAHPELKRVLKEKH